MIDYVGYALDYTRFSIGISERRTVWVIRRIGDIEANGWSVVVRSFQELHGRLGYMSTVLAWMRPFLAAGYSWCAATRTNGGAMLVLPRLVRACCVYIREKLKLGQNMHPCEKQEVDLGQTFRTDAKCERNRIVLGGWSLGSACSPGEAHWFSMEITPDIAPWLFNDLGESSCASTSAEPSCWLPWWQFWFCRILLRVMSWHRSSPCCGAVWTIKLLTL